MRNISSTVLAIFALAAAANSALKRDVDGVFRSDVQIQAIRDDADTNRQCHQANADYLSSLEPGQYAANAFHNCFRTSQQIFEFVDTLVDQNANIMTKFAVSKTVRGRVIYGYKLSTGGGKAQSLYFESMLHAREWMAGSTALFTLSSILDDIANNRATATDLYDLIFVPIVNIDGYEITWSGNRYQRKNANEVDLNRNWPSYYKDPNPAPPSSETYPGPRPLSEPETQGIQAWIAARQQEIAGIVDIHSYAGLVMYPYGDTQSSIGGGEDEKFVKLATSVQNQMGSNYEAQPAAALYVAYGCFDDYHYRTYKKPVLTLELTGTDFVAPASTIKTRGAEVYRGLVQFAKEAVEFNGGNTPKPSTSKPTTTPRTTVPSPTPSATMTPITSTPKPTTPLPTTLKPTTSKPATSKPTTPKPTTPKPTTRQPGCASCSSCYFPNADWCLSDFSKDDCNYFGADYGTVWCGN